MAETSTIFGFMKYVSATDILSDFKKTVDGHFVNSLYNVNIIVYCMYINYTIYLQLTCIIYLNYFYWYHFDNGKYLGMNLNTV